MKKSFIGILLIFITSMSFAQVLKPVFMILTGETKENVPVFKTMDESHSLFRKLNAQFSKGFLAESVKLHSYVQNFLYNNNKINAIEPVYLAITNNIGGYANYGFALESSEGLILKKQSYYIDLSESVMMGDGAKLSSFTQIFPHELGHILINLLINKAGEPEIMGNTVIHYFSTPTDYFTAFSEGFAEHFEPTSVYFEPDQRIRQGVREGITETGKRITKSLHGFDRDFSWPLRMGFYRATAPFWFQQVENLKRHKFADNGLVAHKPRMRHAPSNACKAMLYRNTSLWPDLRMYRHPAEAASTEGVISTFFTRMMRSDLRKQYYSEDLYTQFLPDTAGHFLKSVIPLENQYIKVFYTIAKYVKANASPKSQMIDFIEGYSNEFPVDAEIVQQLWKEVSGSEYNARIWPELWVMNSECSSYPWVMSQFGPKLPFFLFNLNSADTAQLMTFKGMNETEAGKIIQWREKEGPFYTLSQIKEVDGIDAGLADKIAASVPDTERIKKHTLKPSMSGLVVYPLWHLFKMSLLWFVLIGGLFALIMFKRKEKINLLKPILLYTQFFIFVLLATACMLFDKPIMLFGGIVLAFIFIQAFILRKNLINAGIYAAFTLLMALITFYSMY